jgi:hypothetical protein
VFVADVAPDLVATATGPAGQSVDLLGMVQNQLNGVLADAGRFGAVAALVRAGATTGLVLRAGGRAWRSTSSP